MKHLLCDKTVRPIGQSGQNFTGVGVDYDMKCGDIDGAWRVFKVFKDQEIGMWNTIVAGWPNIDTNVFTNGRTNFNSTRIAILDDMGRFFSSGWMQFNASDSRSGINRSLTMD